MLDDRDYMRQPEYSSSGWGPSFRPRWSWTVILLICYGVVFLLELAQRQFYPNNDFFYRYLYLSTEGLRHGYIWQLVTYQFIHAGWLHILLNSWVIFIFGREMESVLGAKKFLTLVFTSGILGGLIQMLASFLLAGIWFSQAGTAVIGASACAFGLITAFALMFPDRELTLLLLYIIPVHIRAKTLLMACLVIALVGIALHKVFMPHVAHFAHLGGMAMGWIFVRYILPANWSRVTEIIRPVEKPIRRAAPRVQVEPPEEPSGGDFMESEVDPILDKISAHGIQSLTAREREILENARKHVRRS